MGLNKDKGLLGSTILLDSSRGTPLGDATGITFRNIGKNAAYIDPSLVGMYAQAIRNTALTYPDRKATLLPVECGVPRHPETWHVAHRPAPEAAPTLPVYSSTGDLAAFVRALVTSTTDLTADITGLEIPKSDIPAFISGWSRESTSDLIATFYSITADYKYLYASIRGLIHTSTAPLSYENVVIATPRGLSLLSRQLTLLPDITAGIYGWELLDLGAVLFVRQRGYANLRATIGYVGQDSYDLYASIVATYIEDFVATLVTIPYESIIGIITSVSPSDLITSVVPIPPKDIAAIAGGHFPSDITASLLVNLPFPIIAWIRSGLSGTSDLGATLTAYGGYTPISAYVKVFDYSISELYTSVICRIPKYIYGYITGWALSDIGASVVGVYSSDIGGWVTPWYTNNTTDMACFARAAWEDQSDLPTAIYGWVSTHTSDKPYNYHLYRRFPKRILIGQYGGLSLIRIEPIRGYFPDLHATLTVIPLHIAYLKAYINPVVPTSLPVLASASSVTRVITITKIIINTVNIGDLTATISAFSGYSNMSANVRGVVHASTSTAAGSRWVRTSSTLMFYIGTNRGLVIPNRTASTIRSNYFFNTSLLPDIVAYIHGWDVSYITASITVSPYAHILGVITALDLTHKSDISSSITSIYTSDITASLFGLGGFVSIGATIGSLGGASDLQASIKPYLKILGYRVIAVETMPFLDLAAVVGVSSVCANVSTYSNLDCYITGCSYGSVGSGVLYASIEARTDINNIQAAVTGRRYVRYKLLDLWFRTKTRSSKAVTALVIGVGYSYDNLAASIRGVSHESDLSASITTVRYRLSTPKPLDTIKVYKGQGQYFSLYKELELTFSSVVDYYIYDAIDGALYPLDNGRWVLNLSELTTTGLFFDRSPNDRSLAIDNIAEYDSIDEAIRDAIRILTEMRQSDLYASISCTGSVGSIKGIIYGTRLDRVSDLTAKVTLVSNIPDLYASISAFSGYSPISAHVVGCNSGSPVLYADVRGVVYSSISAEVTGIT